jgi:L-ribulose-5-phosphate 4-epimerase
MLLQAIRQELVLLNQALPKNGLVAWTCGNVSVRDPETGYVAIKASGLKFEDLTPETMVVVDLEGNVIDGDLSPSSDTASHLVIYRHRPDVNGVAHTHSSYATAFAALGRPIPVYLTAIADEFGGPIPCGGFALIGGEEIGQRVVEAIGDSPAVLLKNHGVFTVGKTAEAAVKAAVMVEDVARTVWIAMQLGQPEEIPAKNVAELHHRHTHEYGQLGAAGHPGGRQPTWKDEPL